MSKYADIEQIKEVIRTEWVKYMPMDLDISLSFVLGKIAEVPTIEVSEDSISRKGLIDSFLADNECDTREEAKACMCSLDFMLELIEDAPSVALSRAEGEWKYGDLGQAYDFPTCSKCGYEVEEETNYCPNCGAKMKGVEDE